MLPRSKIDFLCICFGLPTWLMVVATWSGLSQIAEAAPEGYSISSYLTIALTSGGFLPFFVGKFLYGAPNERLLSAIRLILFIGLGAGISLSIFWKSSVIINGHGVSLPLYIIFFTVGCCGASSNVTHFMFVSKFPPRQTTMLSTGMGIGSMTAGLLALLQHYVLLSKGFTLSGYLFLLSLAYVPAIISFHILSKEFDAEISSIATIVHSKTEYAAINEDPMENPSSSLVEHDEDEFLKRYQSILALQFLSSAIGNGLVPSLISSICQKFNDRNTILLMATSITCSVEPWSRAFTQIRSIDSKIGLVLAALTLVSLTIVLFIILSLPTNSPLYSVEGGGALPALTYISIGMLCPYTTTCIFLYFKSHVSNASVQSAYRWSGVSLQLGAMAGSFAAFALIITKVAG